MLNRLRLRNFILNYLPFLADLKEGLSLSSAYRDWCKNGISLPAPHPIKRGFLMREARRIQAETFVETGTFTGDTVWFMRYGFKKIISIEVQPNLAGIAKKRFRNYDSVEIIEGDSSKILSTLAGKIEEPTLFWLDGHYSAGVTGRGEKDCPIFEELEAIKGLSLKTFSIVIDDYHCFGSDPSYPTWGELSQRLAILYPNLEVSVELDMIWCRCQAGQIYDS